MEPTPSDDRGDLLAGHLDLLRGYVRGRLGAKLRTKESSLDLVQSVCREALRDLDAFEDRGEGSFRAWLLTRAENKIKDRGRFWARERRDPSREISLAAEARNAESGAAEVGDQLAAGASPHDVAAAREELRGLEEAFAGLPDDYREVIVLTKLEGLSHAEAGERLGRTPGATRSLLCRALARLATGLDEDALEGDSQDPNVTE